MKLIKLLDIEESISEYDSRIEIKITLVLKIILMNIPNKDCYRNF